MKKVVARGLNLDLPGTKIYGHDIIVGNVVICKEGMHQGEVDLTPFNDDEVEAVVKKLKVKLNL